MDYREWLRAKASTCITNKNKKILLHIADELDSLERLRQRANERSMPPDDPRAPVVHVDSQHAVGIAMFLDERAKDVMMKLLIERDYLYKKLGDLALAFPTSSVR